MRRLYHFLLLFPLAVTLLCSCGIRHTAAVLDDVETYIQERPDSALATLRAIDTTTLATRSLRAQYALLNATALDKNWIDTTDVSVVMPAVTYYDRHPSGLNRAKAWYYLGRIQENRGDYPSAHISFLKAAKEADNSTDSYFRARAYQSLSNTYSAGYLLEEAFLYSERAFRESEKNKDTVNMNASRYRMAQDLNNLHRHQEADSIYQILLTEKKVSSHLWPSLLSDYALLVLQYRDDCALSVQLFEEALREAGYLRTHNHWGAYAYALLRIGKAERANKIFQQLAAADNDESLTYKTWRARADAYLGLYSSAYENISLASDIQQKNVARVLRQSTLEAQNDYLEEEHATMRLRAQRQRLFLIATLLIVLALATGIIVFLTRKKRKILEEQESILESLQSLSADYSHARDERSLIRNQYIKLCQTHFQHIGRINEILNLFSSERDTNFYKELKKAVRNIKDDEKNQEEFEKILNDSLNDVMIHFKEAFPNQKKRFYQIASFLFAGFDATTISNILYDCSKNNVYLIKNRLKKSIQESNTLYKEQFLSLLS